MPTSWKNLSLEIWSTMFNHVQTMKTLAECRLICKIWNLLADALNALNVNHPSLLKYLAYRYPNVIDVSIYSFVTGRMIVESILDCVKDLPSVQLFDWCLYDIHDMKSVFSTMKSNTNFLNIYRCSCFSTNQPEILVNIGKQRKDNKTDFKGGVPDGILRRYDHDFFKLFKQLTH